MELNTDTCEWNADTNIDEWNTNTNEWNIDADTDEWKTVTDTMNLQPIKIQYWEKFHTRTDTRRIRIPILEDS